MTPNYERNEIIKEAQWFVVLHSAYLFNFSVSFFRSPRTTPGFGYRFICARRNGAICAQVRCCWAIACHTSLWLQLCGAPMPPERKLAKMTDCSFAAGISFHLNERLFVWFLVRCSSRSKCITHTLCDLLARDLCSGSGRSLISWIELERAPATHRYCIDFRTGQMKS